MPDSNGRLRQALGIATSVIASEHYFSTYLSSPWTTQKFSETEQDKVVVWNLFWTATMWSFLFAIVMSYFLETWYPIISVIVVTAGYYYIYNKALNHELGSAALTPISITAGG